MKDTELYRIHALQRDVLLENDRQVAKWGIQDHSSFEWLTFLMEEAGELAEAISEYEYRGGHSTAAYKEAIQVATLALKVAEMFRNRAEIKVSTR
jgi:NTP pyrophosphatase (non-canonical NTP hydrolase)